MLREKAISDGEKSGIAEVWELEFSGTGLRRLQYITISDTENTDFFPPKRNLARTNQNINWKKMKKPKPLLAE